MIIGNAMLLRFASGVSYGFRDRQRFELVPKITCCKKMCKQSSQQLDQSCFCTNTRTTHTRQNKPYRLGAVRAGVVEARGRCSPAATVPAAVVFACGVRCCITEKKQNKITTEKLSSAIIVHEAKRTVTNTRTKHKAEQSLLAWLGAGGSTRSTRPLLSSSDGARSCRNRPRCLMMYSSKKQKKTNKTNNTRYLRATLN